MAETTNTTPGTTQGQPTIANNGQAIPLPNGQQVTIQVNPGDRVLIDFDPSTAEVTRVGDDLVLKFEDGGQITLAGFAKAAEGANPPSIMLPDGQTVIAGDVLVAQLGDGDPTDLETAAGGDAGGGGGSAYDDFFGNTIDPFGAQGPLDPTPFPISLPDPDETQNPLETPNTFGRTVRVMEDGQPVGGGLIDPGSDLIVAASSVGTFPSAGGFGSITINADGTFSYDPDDGFANGDGDSIVQRMAEGETITLQSDVDLVDPVTGETFVQTIEVIITGVNDAPVAHSDANELTAGMVAYDDHEAMTAPIIEGNVLQDIDRAGLNDDQADIDIDNQSVISVLSVRAVSTSPANVAEQEAAHDTMATAQSLDGLFSLTTDPLVALGGTVPHVSVEGTGGGEGSGKDFYSFTVTQDGSVLSIDLDFGSLMTGEYQGENGSFDDYIIIRDTEGNIVDVTQVSVPSAIDAGSEVTWDASDQFVMAAGEYTIEVLAWPGQDTSTLTDNATYILNISLENAITGGGGGTADTEVLLGADDTATLSGAYGELTLNADGSYSYDLDDANATVVALDDGQKVVDTFEYTITDEFGATDVASLQIIVTGNNDGPTAIADTNFIDLGAGDGEQSSPMTSGNVLMDGAHGDGRMDVADTDPDTTEGALTVTAVAGGSQDGDAIYVQGVYGTLEMFSDGTYNYYIDDVLNEDLVALGDGDQATDTFTYTASDGDKDASTTLTIYIEGEDEITLSVTDGVVDEAALGDVDASGTVTASISGVIGSDPASDAETDTGSSSIFPPGAIYTMTVNGTSVPNSGSVDVVGTYGTLTISLDGDWSYTLDSPYDHDEGGATDDIVNGAESFEVIVTEGSFSATDYIDIDIIDDEPTVSVSGTSDGETLSSLNLNVDETDDAAGTDRYASGESSDDMNPDGNAGAAGLGTVTTSVGVQNGGIASLFTIGGDYGADGAGTVSGALSFAFVGDSNGELTTNLSATDGGAIHLELSGDQTVNGVDTDGHVVFSISIVDVSGDPQLQLTQNEAIVHGDTSLFDEVMDLLLGDGNGEGAMVQLQYDVTRTDGDGDQVFASDQINLIDVSDSFFSFDDDGPTQTVVATSDGETLSGLTLNVDETDDAAGTDRYASGDFVDSMNPDGNDAAAGLGAVTTSISGGLTSLFTPSGDYGSDGAGAVSGAMSFVFVGDDNGVLTTNLSATDGGTIRLEVSNDGQTVSGLDTDDDVVFTIVISGDQLVLTQNEAIVHGDTSLFDEVANLLLGESSSRGAAVQLQYEVTRTDGDGDQIVASDQIDLVNVQSSFFSFDDDGPTQTVVATSDGETLLGLTLNVDETDDVAGTDRYASGEGPDDMNPDGNAGTPGLGTVTTSVAVAGGGLVSLFTPTGDYGSDGPGTVSGDLSFVFSGADQNGDLLTNLSATDGGAITLELSNDGNTITGVDTDSDPVFTISIVGSGDPIEYQVVLTMNEAVVHSDGSLYDEVANLLVATGGLVQLQYEVTRTDGDGDPVVASDQIDLISDSASFYSFDDDGPRIDNLQNLVIANESGTYKGTVDLTAGADGLDSYDLGVLAGTDIPDGMTYTTYVFGQTLPDVVIAAGLSVPEEGGSLLVSTLDADGSVIFGLSIDTNGQYCFDLVSINPTTTTDISFDGMPPGNYPGGLYYDIETDTWSSTEPSDPELLVSASDTLNVSGQGFGDGNNHYEEEQVLTFDFFADVSDVSIVVDRAQKVGDSTTVGTKNPLEVVWVATLLGVVVYDSSIEGTNVDIVEENQVLNFTPGGGIVFDTLTITALADDDGKLYDEQVTFSSITYSETVLPSDLNLAFDLGATDGDSDVDGGPLYINIEGGGEIDVLIGDQNATFLDDILIGGLGDDTLVGGLGDDSMTGGAGADTFDFNAIAEASTLNSTDGDAMVAGDVITDLTSEDIIDIADLLADAAFTGTANYGIIVDPEDGTNAILQIKDDTTLVAEITIEDFASGDGITTLADILATVDIVG